MNTTGIPSLRKPRRCPGCGTEPGKQHYPGCDVERCSVCGRQHLSCGCPSHDPGFARWSGWWPGYLEAQALGIDLNELCRRGWEARLFVKPNTPPDAELPF